MGRLRRRRHGSIAGPTPTPRCSSWAARTPAPGVTSAGWAATANAKPVIGDFDGDGLADVALTGASGWATLPVAFSNGDGTFNVTNQPIVEFAGWAATTNAKPLVGDFNGDGKTDVALTGPSGWATMPVAFSLSRR